MRRLLGCADILHIFFFFFFFPREKSCLCRAEASVQVAEACHVTPVQALSPDVAFFDAISLVGQLGERTRALCLKGRRFFARFLHASRSFHAQLIFTRRYPYVYAVRVLLIAECATMLLLMFTRRYREG